MQSRLGVVITALVAIAGWWGIFVLTGRSSPEDPGTLVAFYALWFLACTASLILPFGFLNRRLAPRATQRAPRRFLRHAVWAGLGLTSWAWLQMHRALNLSFAVIIALIFVAVELLVMRIRGETS
jgi:hypothetical protein